MKKKLRIVLVYNGTRPQVPDAPEDRGGIADLIKMIRQMARALRALGHEVIVLPLGDDLLAFHRRLRRINPDVVFNQYDDVMQGALYEVRAAALVAMLGYPMTGSPPLAIGLVRYKHVCASLLQGVGVPVPPDTRLIERIGKINEHSWTFPLIVQPAHEDAGIGLDRNSVVYTKKALREKVRQVMTEFRQPVLVQRFLPGREIHVGILGGRRLRVLPLAEVDYSELPPDIPPIMSYAAKWLENTTEYKKTSIICPASVEPELTRKITRIALRAFQAVGGWGYGRVDMRLDESGEPYVLEVNCNASLEEGMGLARQAAAAGISYPQLLNMVVEAALERPPFEVVLPM
jgi:D-alanine-D-alanine ligase